LEDGSTQGKSNDHCFSCHVTSQTVKFQDRTHAFEVGIQADVAENHTVGYEFGYRVFQPQGMAPSAYYDEAKHPGNGGSQAEFGSRQNFDEVTMVFDQAPETEKINNKVRAKGKLGQSTKYKGSVGYSVAKNKNTQLETQAWSGAAALSTVLSPSTRLVVRASGLRQTADDPFIDLPIFRAGRPGPQVDFDYTRYSTLDRFDLKGTAELIHRLNKSMTLSALIGFENLKRDDYPDEDYASKTFIGQAKLRYRKGSKFSGWAKYRFEKTSDPFVSARGLFEARGREVMVVDTSWTLPFHAFYHQREALRYQPITTAPTDYHEIEGKATFRPSPTVGVDMGLKVVMDKNGDLDSLDVKHSKFTPSVGLNLTPNPQWAVSAGYQMMLAKSRGPVTIALFDG
ncbi:MAG: TonB-dependent receptor, partial [candidate division Zixibacteria bacterium]|nr:TonB-dependent receptor [candidate division Zixibacteria bacterium]